MNISYPIPTDPEAAPTTTALVKFISNLTKVHDNIEVIVEGRTP